MRDPRRIERILALLKENWSNLPDFRFGQLVFTVAWLERIELDNLANVEDDRWEQALDHFLEQSRGIAEAEAEARKWFDDPTDRPR